MLVTHDKSPVNANDAASHGWLKDGQVPLRPKGRGKGIMVGFSNSQWYPCRARLHL